MISNYIINDSSTAIFIPIILRIIVTLIAGLVLIVILNQGKFKGIWKTEVGKRYLGWLFIIPIYLIAVLFWKLGVLILFIVHAYGIKEFAQMTKMNSKDKLVFLGLSAITILTASLSADKFYLLPALYLLVVSAYSISKNKRTSFIEATTMIFFSLWIFWGLSHLILMVNFSNILDVRSLFIFLLFSVSLSDVFAYVFGKYFSKLSISKRLTIAHKISPNKTYLGIVGNIFGVLLGGSIMYFSLSKYLLWFHWLILATIIVLFGVLGDLTESMLKRFYKVKNSGDLILGHGGVLDRVDSLVFVSMGVYYYLYLFT